MRSQVFAVGLFHWTLLPCQSRAGSSPRLSSNVSLSGVPAGIRAARTRIEAYVRFDDEQGANSRLVNALNVTPGRLVRRTTTW
jgi:hypothetical protein